MGEVLSLGSVPSIAGDGLWDEGPVWGQVSRLLPFPQVKGRQKAQSHCQEKPPAQDRDLRAPASPRGRGPTSSTRRMELSKERRRPSISPSTPDAHLSRLCLRGPVPCPSDTELPASLATSGSPHFPNHCI